MKRTSQLENLLLAQLKLFGVPPPLHEYRFMPPRRYRFDLAWTDRMLAVEVEGGTWANGRHNRGRGYESDCRKYNFAILRGWKVFRFTGGMVRSWEAARTIREYLGGGS